MKKRQLWDRGFRRNSSLQAAWGTSIARTTGFMWHQECYPYWGGQNLAAVELSECINMWLWVCMRPHLIFLYIIWWIGQTITRNRTQNMSGEWRGCIYIAISGDDAPYTKLRRIFTPTRPKWQVSCEYDLRGDHGLTFWQPHTKTSIIRPKGGLGAPKPTGLL